MAWYVVASCALNQALISGKKVQFRKPAPGAADAVPSRKRATPINLANAIRKSSGSVASSVLQRPFRDRVLHLLALRPYRKAELLLRLQKDGLTQADKDTLDSLLQQVGTDQPDLMCCVSKQCKKTSPGFLASWWAQAYPLKVFNAPSIEGP